jgi:hypothetical protein
LEDVGIFYGYLEYFTEVGYTLWPFGVCCGHLVYVIAIWYILWSLGIFFLALVCFTKKNLATLLSTNNAALESPLCKGRLMRNSLGEDWPDWTEKKGIIFLPSIKALSARPSQLPGATQRCRKPGGRLSECHKMVQPLGADPQHAECQGVDRQGADPSRCRPVKVPTPQGADPSRCRPLKVPTHQGADPSRCQPIKVPTRQGADPSRCRPVKEPTHQGANIKKCRPFNKMPTPLGCSFLVLMEPCSL